MNLHFKIAYNTSIQIVGRVVSALTTLGIVYLIAQKFSTPGYGFYVSVTSYVALFYVLTDFGLNAIFIKETSGEKDKQKEYFFNLLGLRLTASLLVIFLALSILAFTPHPVFIKLGIIVSLALIIAQSFSNSYLAFFQGEIDYNRAVLADTIGAVANLFFVFIAAQIFDSLILVILALVAGGFVRALVGFYLVAVKIGSIKFFFNRQIIFNLIKLAFPLGLITIFSQFNAQIDKQIVLLAHYKESLTLSGQIAAGIYGFAYKLFEMGIIVPGFLINVVFPIMIAKKAEGEVQLLEFSKRIGLILLIFGLVALLCGWVLAPWVVKVLAGEKFVSSVTTARLLFLGFPLFYITSLLLWLAVTLDKFKEMVFIYFFAALFNFVANSVFVPNFGYNAAAVITVISELLIFLLSLFVLFISQRRNVGLSKDA